MPMPIRSGVEGSWSRIEARGGEFLAVEELEIAGPDRERGEHGVRAFDQQG